MILKIINVTSEKLTQGSEIWLEAKLMICKSRWHSTIRSLRPYQYLDEMLTGPFNFTHLHRFYDINSNNNQKHTAFLHTVDFRNSLIIERQLQLEL